MRYWVKPDQLAKLNITVSDVIQAVQSQNTVNPAGLVGGEPAPKGQEFTYSVRAQGRLTSPEEFGAIIIRANPDGSTVRLRDVARVELGAQVYNLHGKARRETRPRTSPSTSSRDPTHSTAQTAPRRRWREFGPAFPRDSTTKSRSTPRRRF